MIQANDVCLSFGEQIVFDNISFTINQQDRVGLVGRNGSGKSTLLKVIGGQQPLDDGSIAISNKKTVAYMPQEVVLESDKTVIEETLTACNTLENIQKEIALIDEQLANHDPDVDLDKYSELQIALTEINPARVRAEAIRMLTGLGFKDAQMETPVANLSVGWKMRIVLAQLLLKKADFYLFDEPTNHLDIVAKEWFLEFLQASNFGFMLVSHEKYFLNKLCTEILEIELGKATFYNGNYDNYVVQKEHNLQLLQAAQLQQQKEIKLKMEFVEKFKASAARSKQAQSVLRAVEKIERITLPPAPKTMTFNFPPIVQSGRVVLDVKDVSQKFQDKTIFEHATFQIERGQKIAVIAANGVGKTTLFNIIIGQLPLQHGSIEFGYNVQPTIFAQDQTKSLDGNKTIFENVIERCPKKTESQIRSFLGAFLFSNDDVHKKVKVLSGGEKNRVGMVCVLLQDANFLLLDEPTNHLDIPSKDILLSALKAFKGTILFVSHDHDFVHDLATNVIELSRDGTYVYPGTYESYLYHKKHMQKDADEIANGALPEKEQAQESKKNNDYEHAKQLKKLEQKIAKAEKDVQTFELRFADLAYGTLEFKQTQKKLENAKKELETLTKEWEELQD
jgi:ATP-binding cassette subfamily F protein 3